MTEFATTPCDPNEKVICDGFLWSFVQDELDPAEALFVAAHCQLSCDAKKRLKALTTCAGTALEQIEPKTMRCSAQAFFAEKCTEENKPQPEFHCVCDVPKALQPLIGTSFDEIKWKTVYPGIQEKRLKIAQSEKDVRLIRINKNIEVPAHSHGGDELTLVLKGMLADEGQAYRPGDVSVHKASEEGETHAPQALEECVCLVVTGGAIRLQGWLGKILRPFQKSPSPTGRGQG